MALCDKCLFMTDSYDDFRQAYNDVEIIGDNTVEHFCPMYDDHIPNNIYYEGGACERYVERE